MEIVQDKNSGFTLVELLVTMISMILVMGAVYSIFSTQTKRTTAEQEILNMQMNGRVAIERLSNLFSNAGFGCFDSFADGKTMSGNDPDGLSVTVDSFLWDIQNKGVNESESDSVVVVLGFKKVAEVDGFHEETNSINLKNKETPAISDSITTFKNYINFFPDFNGDVFYKVTDSRDPYLLDRRIRKLPDGSDVFMVSPIRVKVQNKILYFQNFSYASTPFPQQYWEVASNIEKLQIQYTTDGMTWTDQPAQPQKVIGVWIFLLLKTEKIDPGFQDTKKYVLAGQTLTTLEPGYHYLLCQRKIWIRNAS
jgi:type IV pilus assembly protein PilW